MPRDSKLHTFLVAFVLCICCSVVVSVAAVLLRPTQQVNKQEFMKKNILVAAGLFNEKQHSNKDIESLYQQVEARIVDLETGDYTDAVKVENYDPRKASKDPDSSRQLTSAEDPAVLKRREKYAFVYLIKNGNTLDQIVLPIRGYGLWSTLYGFISLDADLTTIRGITFYEHGETPGLGGEVDNPLWKSRWNNSEDPKQVFDESWNFKIEVIKGMVVGKDPHKVDGLSGATITTRGVSNMLLFWFGEKGFGPFLNKLREGDSK